MHPVLDINDRSEEWNGKQIRSWEGRGRVSPSLPYVANTTLILHALLPCHCQVQKCTIHSLCAGLCVHETMWFSHMGDVPPKTAGNWGKATPALQCSWISMTAWWQYVCLCQEAAITSSVGGSLEDYSSKAQQAFLDHHDSSVAAWLSLAGALHGCVYDRTIQEKDTRM